MSATEKKPFNKTEYDKQYDSINSKHYSLKMVKHHDADIINELATHDSIQGYIKSAIRSDIARKAGWTYDRVRRLSFTFGGSTNCLFTMAKRASLQDPDHAYVVCILADGTPSILMASLDQEVPMRGTEVYFPIIIYTCAEKMSDEQIEQHMSSYNPIFDRIDAYEKIFKFLEEDKDNPDTKPAE